MYRSLSASKICFLLGTPLSGVIDTVDPALDFEDYAVVPGDNTVAVGVIEQTRGLIEGHRSVLLAAAVYLDSGKHLDRRGPLGLTYLKERDLCRPLLKSVMAVSIVQAHAYEASIDMPEFGVPGISAGNTLVQYTHREEYT